MKGIPIFNASAPYGKDVRSGVENVGFCDFLELHDLLPNNHFAVDKVVGGRKGDGHGSLHTAALQVRWDSSPGGKIKSTPRIKQPRSTIVAWTVVRRSCKGDAARHSLWDMDLKDRNRGPQLAPKLQRQPQRAFF